jgi:tRNA threonylcarbamoyladenosine biosynthesis protein TsaB
MNDIKVIAIETSSRHGSIAVGQGGRLIDERTFAAQTDHARDLLPTLDGLCGELGWRPDEIGHCCVSIGPGSFTGLRVAVTFARALALAQGVKVCAVPTLNVIAENCLSLAEPPRRLAVILDAKRQQVFGAVFELEPEGQYKLVGEPRLVEPRSILCGDAPPSAVTGEGIDHHREAVAESAIAVVDRQLWIPRAACVHRLGWNMAERGAFTPATQLVPHYLRRPEAEELWEKRREPDRKPIPSGGPRPSAAGPSP